MVRAWLTEEEAGAGGAAGDVAGDLPHTLSEAKLHQNSNYKTALVFRIELHPEGLFCIHGDMAYNASQSYMPEGLFCIHDDAAYNASHSMLQLLCCVSLKNWW